MVVGSRRLLHVLIIVVMVIYSVLLVTTYSRLLNYIVIFFVSIAIVYGIARFFKLHIGVFTVITSLILVLISLYTMIAINIFYLYYYLIGLAAVLISVFIISKYTQIQFVKRHHRVDIILVASVVIYGFLILQYTTGQLIGTELRLSDNLTLTASSDFNYTWYPENKGKLNSLRLSGELSGNVKVYLVDEDTKTNYLILDSSSISSSPEAAQTSVATQTQQISPFESPVITTPSAEPSATQTPETTEAVTETPSETTVPSPESSPEQTVPTEPTQQPSTSPEPSESSPQPEAAQSPETTISAKSQSTIVIYSGKIRFQDATPETESSIPQPTELTQIPTPEPSQTSAAESPVAELPQSSEPTETIQQPESNLTPTPEQTTEPRLSPSETQQITTGIVPAQTQISQPISPGTKQFTSFCHDTCKLPDLKGKKYTIKVVVEGQGSIFIGSIDYTILKKTKKISIAVKDNSGKEFGDYNITERRDGKFDLVLDINESQIPDKTEFDITALQIAKTGGEITPVEEFSDPEVEIKGLVDPPAIIEAKIDSVEDPQISTDAFAMEPLEFDNATITLPKNGKVSKIFSCAEFDIDFFECPRWEPTNIPFTDNGDTITFTVTHFSAYAGGIINITTAEHLNSNRTLISDIFAETRALDGIWSETIPSGDYVRVTFEKNLTFNNDITIYPRTISGTPKIEIYEIDGTNLIAEFTSLNDNQYNKVYLTNLQGTQDTFDLKVLNSSVEFDHIVDPSTSGTQNISFISPTPANVSVLTTANVIINTSIEDPNLNSVTYNWNGTNYTFYNNSLVVLYNMDNLSVLGESDALVADLAWGIFNGTSVGNALPSSTGYFGGGYVFDGVGDLINISMNTNLSTFFGTNESTLIVWVKLDAATPASAQTGIFWLGGSAFSSHYPWTDGKIYMDAFRDDRIVFSPSASVTRTNWHMIAVTNKPGASGWNFYQNDILVNSTTGEPAVYLPPSPMLGRSKDSTRAFDGSMDQFMLWNRSLSADEIKQMYMTGLSRLNQTHWNLYVNQTQNSTTLLTNGTYTFQVDISNSTGSVSTGQNKFLIGTAPSVALNNPADAATVTANPVDFNFTATTGTNSLSSCTLYHNGTGTFASNQSTTILTSGQQTNITVSMANANYTWNVQCSDSTGISNFASANRTVGINVSGSDTTAPSSLTYESPTPASGSNLSQNYYFVNLSFTETNPNNCLLEVNGANV
ncbi:MAG: hypothetical protein HY512_01550, partial [Candidatus Aenigmarchaeota archaeon]|nr:hypothetical protein [Candidatus Aenigmarchaeota archaeon]